MPMIYGLALATPGNTATNASANTETSVFTMKPGVRNASLQSWYVLGKGAGLTAISGIVMRIRNYATASTSGTGTAVTPTPKDPGMQAAKAACFSGSGITVGSTATQHLSFGCGAAGPGGWVAPNPDSLIVLQGGGAASTDVLSASGSTSLNFEWSGELQE